MLALDIETTPDRRQPSGQRMTCASLVDVETGRLRQFQECTVMDLIACLLTERIVGFNIISFDLRILNDYLQHGSPGAAGRPGPTRPLHLPDLTALPHALDLYRDLWQRTGRNDISLDELSTGTLGQARPSHGGDLYSLGQTRRLLANSANGTRELAAIYRFGLRNQFVRWVDDQTGLPHEIPVHWT